jgi:hypothetical protein
MRHGLAFATRRLGEPPNSDHQKNDRDPDHAGIQAEDCG